VASKAAASIKMGKIVKLLVRAEVEALAAAAAAAAAV
jgi:hypothetical protein